MALLLATATLLLTACGKETTKPTQTQTSEVPSGAASANIVSATVAANAFTPCEDGYPQAAMAKGVWPIDSVIVTTANGEIFVDHRNIYYYCGVDTVLTQIILKEDTIIVTETLNFPYEAVSNCGCFVSNRFKITDIAWEGANCSSIHSDAIILKFQVAHKVYSSRRRTYMDTTQIGLKIINNFKNTSL